MTKRKLIETLGAKCGITVTQAERYLNTLAHIIYDELGKGGDVQWHGFGTWSVFHMKPTLRRNPRTGELMNLPAHKRVKFRVGETLKRITN